MTKYCEMKIILLGAVLTVQCNQNNLHTTPDVSRPISVDRQSYTDLLKRLSAVYLKNKLPIKIFASTEELTMNEQTKQIQCPDIEGFGVKTIYIEKLLEKFKIYWVPIKEDTETFLYIIPGDNPDPEICISLSKLLRKTTAVPSTQSCSHMSNTPEHSTKEITMTTTADTTSTPSKHIVSREQNSSCIEVSLTVIVSLCSFIAGTLFSMCMWLLCRFHCFRKRKDNSADEIMLDNVTDEKAPTSKILSNSDVKTYETLNGQRIPVTEQTISDHVYLGLCSSSRSSDITDSKNAETAIQNNSKDSSEEIFEQNSSMKKDQINNILESGETDQSYQNSKGNTLQEHTYTSLNYNIIQDRNVKYEDMDKSEQLDDIVEGHDYFVLADEGNQTPNNVTDKSNECQSNEELTFNV